MNSEDEVKIDTSSHEVQANPSKTGGEVSTRPAKTVRKIADIPEISPWTISKGDLCIAFFNPFHQKLFKADTVGTLDTKYGHYNMIDMIGKQFGALVTTHPLL